MKKYNLHLLKVEEVRTICAHNTHCETCPLAIGDEAKCPFAKASYQWGLE